MSTRSRRSAVEQRSAIETSAAAQEPLRLAEALPPPRELARTPTTDRVWMWDRLRLIAFLDIAAFHMHGKHAFAGMGLPLFLVLTFALASRRPTPVATGEVIAGSARRLLVPWLAWSAILGALLAVSGSRHGLGLAQVFRPGMLLYGAQEHLWFLLFAAVAGVGVHLGHRLTQRVSTGLLGVGCVGCAAALLALPANPDLPFPLPQWQFAAPSLPLGLLAGRFLARPTSLPRRRWVLLLAAGCLAMGGYVVQLRGHAGGFAFGRYGLAVAALSLGALLPRAGDAWTPRLTPLLFGAYVLHPVLYHQTLMRLERGAQLQAGILVGLAATVPLAFLATAALRRTPLRAIL